MHWYISVFKRYFNFQGRSRRKEFWSFFSIHLSIVFTLATAGGLMNGIFSIAIESNLSLDILLAYLYLTVIPTLGVVVRRLHDQNRSRFFVLLTIVPYIGTVALLLLLCLPGQSGLNKYDPDPKNPDQEIDTIGSDS